MKLNHSKIDKSEYNQKRNELIQLNSDLLYTRLYTKEKVGITLVTCYELIDDIYRPYLISLCVVGSYNRNKVEFKIINGIKTEEKTFYSYDELIEFIENFLVN